MDTIESHDPSISTDWRVAHHVHMSVCGAVLNFTQVSEVLLDLQRKLPDVRPDLLLRQAQNTFKHLINSGVAYCFVTEGGISQDLTVEESLRELERPACWSAGGRYLATAKVRETTYFESIYENLRHYARRGLPDA